MTQVGVYDEILPEPSSRHNTVTVPNHTTYHIMPNHPHLVDGADHAGEGGGLPLQGVEVRDQHVDRNPGGLVVWWIGVVC